MVKNFPKLLIAASYTDIDMFGAELLELLVNAGTGGLSSKLDGDLTVIILCRSYTIESDDIPISITKGDASSQGESYQGDEIDNNNLFERLRGIENEGMDTTDRALAKMETMDLDEGEQTPNREIRSNPTSKNPIKNFLQKLLK